MKFRNSISIKTPYDWELVASDVIDEFLEDFTDRKGLTRPAEYEDQIDFDGSVSFMYTQKGMKLYDRMVERLDKLGNKIFPGKKFSYSPANIKLP